jgi:DNA-binding MarR family transcriptional regulator
MPTSSARSKPELDGHAVEHLLGYLLAIAEVPTRRAFQRHVGQPFDLRPVEFTLLMLLQTNEQASPKQISTALRMPAPHVTTLVDRLAARDLITRQRHPHDGRAVRVVLTEAGQALVGRLQTVSLTMEDGVQATLTPAERSQLKRLLLKLAQSPAA